MDLTPRRARLAGCACVRHSWALLGHPDSRTAVEVAEAYADGLAGPEALREAFAKASYAERSAVSDISHYGPDARSLAHDAASACCREPNGSLSRIMNSPSPAPKEVMKAILKDINRNGPSAWIEEARREPAILSLALAAYDERLLPAGLLENDRLAVLADALEEVGVGPPTHLLEHLRSPGPHWRGCWALDLVLGKEP